MPKGSEPTADLRKKIERFKKDKWITPKQYEKLSWTHLNQIGEYNQKNKKCGGNLY